MTENHSKPQENNSETTPSSHFKPKHKGLILFGKLAFTASCFIAAYGIYLDGKIRSKMDGQIWRLPAEVYSRIEKISLDDNLTFNTVKNLLLDNNYRQTTTLAAPGDFKIEANQLTLIRRAFPFPTGPEAQRVLRLRFENNNLKYIEDLVNLTQIDEFQLSPKLIGMLQSEKQERLAISLQNYPRLLIDTLLLTEDRNFFQHDGISPLGIIRATITNIQAGQTVQGGSTLTQQLVKNLFLTNERSLSRKATEAIMAVLLDLRYDKNTILETYLNEIYLGQNGDTQIHGFELASHFYFGLPVREISLDQIALLVGMVKGPSLYNPWRNPQNALERRNVVLKLMLDHQIIGQELYDILTARPLGVQPRGQIIRRYPAFLQTVQTELFNRLGSNKEHQLMGAKIFTTLDPHQQQYAENAVINATNELKLKTRNAALQSAMVVVDYKMGEIRAIVGGTQTNYAGFNRAVQAKRQIGSLVKPAVYLAALAEPEKFRLNSPIQNQPITIQTKGSPPWSPRNYDKKFSGSVLLVDALARSLNIPTVNIGMKVGLNKVIETQKAMGWDTVTIPKVPSMLLGSYSISPYDVSKLFQTIANQGERIPLTTVISVTNRQGDMIYEHEKQGTQVVPKQAAFQTLYAMQQVVERGTGRGLINDFGHLNLAAKTGTTNDSRDTWFVGIDGSNLATVWLGLDDNGNTKLTGASGAMQVYRHYLSQLPSITPLKPQKPDQIQWVGINSYGSWNCDHPVRLIPVWADKGQNFCSYATQSSTVENTTQSKSQSNHPVPVVDAIPR